MVDYGLNVYVSHFTLETSKWNKIEQKFFSTISLNWKGFLLAYFEIIVSLIANTSNKSGLKVVSRLDEKEYVTGIKVDDRETESQNNKWYSFRPARNYLIKPR